MSVHIGFILVECDTQETCEFLEWKCQIAVIGFYGLVVLSAVGEEQLNGQRRKPGGSIHENGRKKLGNTSQWMLESHFENGSGMQPCAV